MLVNATTVPSEVGLEPDQPVDERRDDGQAHRAAGDLPASRHGRVAFQFGDPP
jgi:hypothetical protein